MINKLKMSLEQGNGTVVLSNDEASRIFKVLMATAQVIDDLKIDCECWPSYVKRDHFYMLMQSWEEMNE